jgi:hypothetical protein
VSEEDYGRKNEKQEKDEKDRGEREWDKGEQWSGGDALGPIIWGLIIIFAGLALVAVNLRTFPFLTWENVWALILIAAGLLLLLEVVIRVVIPTYRRPVGGRLILVCVLFIIAGGWTKLEITWPLILVAIGVAIIVGALLRPKS